MLQLILSRKLVWKSKEYVVTPERVIVIDGILGKRERVHNMKGVTNMQLRQGALMKTFNYGTIKIFFLGGAEVSLTHIEFPHIHLDRIQTLIDKGYLELDED